MEVINNEMINIELKVGCKEEDIEFIKDINLEVNQTLQITILNKFAKVVDINFIKRVGENTYRIERSELLLEKNNRYKYITTKTYIEVLTCMIKKDAFSISLYEENAEEGYIEISYFKDICVDNLYDAFIELNLLLDKLEEEVVFEMRFFERLISEEINLTRGIIELDTKTGNHRRYDRYKD